MRKRKFFDFVLGGGEGAKIGRKNKALLSAGQN